MRQTTKALPLILLVLAATSPARAQDGSETAIPEKYPAIPAITLPAPEIPGAAESRAATAAVEFPGGKIIGHVRKTTQGEKEILVIDGDVGILLKKDNNGGVLRLDFAEKPADPVKAAFSEFPDGLHPQEAALDGRTVEIEVTAGKGYIHISLQEGKRIVLEKVEFSEGARMSDPEALDRIRIIIHPKFLPDSDALKTILDAVKP